MRKRIGAMILTAVVALCLLPGGARAAGTVQVNTEQQLRDALTGSADVIVLTGNIVVTSEVAIARAVTIRGNGYTIQVPIPGVLDSGLVNNGASAFRVFNISGSGVVIEDLTIKGGDVQGGGMYLEPSAKVTLNRVAITNSGGSSSYGGGFYLEGGAVLHIKNSVINRNSGGAGGGFYSYGVLIIENTSFSENRNTSGGGGAGENNGKLYMNNCTFANNITAGDGGAINNYISNVTIVMNSSFTGNVCYEGGDLGGAIRNGNTSGVANCLFAYNYGKTRTQSTYSLNDFRESSVSQNRMVNSVFHAVPVNAGTGNTPNKQYGGNANGSDNTLFSGGMQMIVTDAAGAQQGTGTVYQPLAYTAPGQFTAVVPLKTGATLGAAGDIPKPVRTIFAPDSSNTSNSYFAYFNETTQKWVSWTSSGWTGTQQPTAAQLEQEVTTDPYGNPKTDLGGTSEEKAKLYTVQLLQTGGWSSMGAVQGATLYGDSYEQGKPIAVMATPNANYRFDHWVVKIGSGAEQTSTANPYTQTMGTENITLYPVFATSSGATGTTVHLTLTTNSIQLGSGTQTLSAGAALTDLASGNSVPSKSITLYALDASGKVLFSKTQPTSSYGIASFSNVWTPTSAGVYHIYASFTGDASYAASTASQDLTVTATVYTLTLDAQGGSGGATRLYEKYGDGFYADDSASSTRKMTSTANPIAIPTRSEYTFGGYYTSANGGGTQVVSPAGYLASGISNTFVSNNSTTLYAKWTLKTYTASVTITKDAAPYTGLSIKLKSNAPVTECSLPENGSTGVYVSNAVPANNYSVYIGDTYMGANLAVSDGGANAVTIAFFTVTYNTQGGSTAPATQTVRSGQRVYAPRNPTKAESIFGGWYTDSACTAGKEWNFDSNTVTQATTLYAKWTPMTYGISMDKTALTFAPRTKGYTTRPAAETVTVTNNGNSPVTLNAPTALAGYEIITPTGWATTPLAAGGHRSFTVQPSGSLDAKLYAGYIKVTTTKSTEASVDASFTVNAALGVAISANPSLSIIAGNSTTLTANVSGGTGTNSYQWSGGGLTATTAGVTVSPTTTTTYTVTVTDQGEGSKSVTETVTVIPATYQVSVDPTSYDFGTGVAGDPAVPAAKTFTITNNGNTAITGFGVTGTGSDYNVVCTSQAIAANGGTATFTVQPKTGLAPGAHSDTFTVNTTPTQTTAVQFTTAFTVTSPTYDIRMTPSSSFLYQDAPAITALVGEGIPGFGLANLASVQIAPQGQPFVTLTRDSQYKAEEGSIKLTLSASYLNTLRPGAYTLRVNLTGAYRPSYVETSIAVVDLPIAPKTGDGDAPWLWLGLLLLSAVGLTVCGAVRRRRAS